MPRSFAVVVNECAAVTHSNVRAVNTRQTPNADQNFRLVPGSLVSGLPRELVPAEMDWLELLTALYATDLACLRGRGDTDWGRDIELHVGLRFPDLMEPHLIAIQEIFMDLTGDRLRIAIYDDEDPAPIPRYGTRWEDFDCVALHSGGADSHTGALRLIHDGRTPLLLSHGSGANTTPQSSSRDALAKARGAMPHAHLTADKTDVFPEPDYSQRARSMLFMGVAALAAAVAEVDEVFLNENGVMAVQLPLTPARFGSLSTKTAYPPIVDRMAHVASAVLDRPIRIDNLLIEHTKPDVVETAVALGGGPDLRRTASCWIWWQHRMHCGVCIPCLQRRISFETHHVADEPARADPFSDPKATEAPFAKDNLVHLCAAVQHLHEADDVTLELDFPELLDGGSQISPESARALYRRWAAQALAVLGRYPMPAAILR